MPQKVLKRSALMNELGTEHIEVTPRETSTTIQTNAELITQLNQIPFFQASAVYE